MHEWVYVIIYMTSRSSSASWGKYAAKVVYRGYGPTYRIIYNIYYGECATDEPFAWKCFAKWRHFCPKSISDICDHFAILKFLWLRNHHGIYIYIYTYVLLFLCDQVTPTSKFLIEDNILMLPFTGIIMYTMQKSNWWQLIYIIYCSVGNDWSLNCVVHTAYVYDHYISFVTYFCMSEIPDAGELLSGIKNNSVGVLECLKTIIIISYYYY